MKKFKLVFAGLGVFAIVSGALAFKPAAFATPNVRICPAATHVCTVPNPAVNLSTISGTNPQQLPSDNPYYIGTGSCTGTNPSCTKLAGGTTVFTNE